MGNSPSRAPAERSEDEEERQREAAASGSSSGLSMLKAGAAVAGTALLALGTWQLLSQLPSGDTADSDEDVEHKVVMRERAKSGSVGTGHHPQLEGFHFQMPSPRNRGEKYIPPYLRAGCNTLKVLSYNVWSGDVELEERMRVIGNLVQEHSPDLICFQEITPKIYEIFANSNWWKEYRCSVSRERASQRNYFSMQLSKLPAKFYRKQIVVSNKRRELCIADVDVGMERNLVFAASHLVSPNPDFRHPGRMYSEERVEQARDALDLLKDYPSVIFGGDMNWDEEADGPLVLPPGWVDAWEQLRPGEDGYTFDTKANKMLSGRKPLQKRLDRFLCKLTDFSIRSIEVIGREEIPGLSYSMEKKVGRRIQEATLPVLPSDHFGLLLTIDRD